MSAVSTLPVMDPTRPIGEIQWELLDWKPTPEQRKVLMCPKRYILVAGGAQSGKSMTAAKYLLQKIPEAPAKARFGLLAADYNRTEREFNYLKDDLIRLRLLKPGGYSKRVDPGFLELGDGTMIATLSGRDPRTIAMYAYDGIVICEASQVELEIYKKCRERTAPTKGWILMVGCLTADTWILTSDGLQRLGDVVGTRSGDADIRVQGMVGPERASLRWVNGWKPVVRVETSKGFHVTGTLDHRVIARLPDGSVDWVELDKLTNKHLVAIRYGTDIWGSKRVDPDIAYLAGLYIAEGCWEAGEKALAQPVLAGIGNNKGRPGVPRDLTRETDRITFTLGDAELAKPLEALGYIRHGHHWRLTDHVLGQAFRDLGIAPEWHATNKQVPPSILAADRPSVRAFLQGLFDGDGTAQPQSHINISLATSSREMGEQVQMLLLNFGVPASLTRRSCKLGTKVFPSYNVNVLDPSAFIENVDFKLERKQQAARLVRQPGFFRNQANAGRRWLGYPVLWCRFQSKTYSQAETFDIHVPGSHSYWANGLTVHNTFEQSIGWYPALYTDWKMGYGNSQSFSLPTWSNTHLFPGGRNNPEILALERDMDAAFFEERFAGIPHPPRGLVFPEFSPDYHVQEMEWDPGIPAEIATDPGYSGYYAVLLVQKVDGQVRVLDEVYMKGLVTEDIITICEGRPWGQGWGRKVIGGAIDVAGYQHQAMAAPAEIWESRTGLKLRAEKVRVADGTERLKSMLKLDPLEKRPRLVVSPRCKGLLSELGVAPNPDDGQLRAYQWKTDRDGNIIGEEPDDKNNHACKALIYWLVAEFGYVTDGQQKVIQVRRW